MKNLFVEIYEGEKLRVEKVAKDWGTLFRAQRGVATLLFCSSITLGIALAVEVTILGSFIDAFISAKSVRTMTSELSSLIIVQMVLVVLVVASLRLRESLSGLARATVDTTVRIAGTASLFFASLSVSPVFVPIMAGIALVVSYGRSRVAELVGASVITLLYIAFCYRLVDAGLYLDRTLGESTGMIASITALTIIILLRPRS